MDHKPNIFLSILGFVLGFPYYDHTHGGFVHEFQIVSVFKNAIPKTKSISNYLIVITDDYTANRNGYKAKDFVLVIEILCPSLVPFAKKIAVRKAKNLKERLRNLGFYRDEKLSNGTDDDSHYTCLIHKGNVKR